MRTESVCGRVEVDGGVEYNENRSAEFGEIVVRKLEELECRKRRTGARGSQKERGHTNYRERSSENAVQEHTLTMSWS